MSFRHQERNPCQRSETSLPCSCCALNSSVTRREIRVNGLKLSFQLTLESLQPSVTRREIRVNGLKHSATFHVARFVQPVTRREIRVNGLKPVPLVYALAGGSPVIRREIRVNGLKLCLSAPVATSFQPCHQERNPCQRSETRSMSTPYSRLAVGHQERNPCQRSETCSCIPDNSTDSP